MPAEEDMKKFSPFMCLTLALLSLVGCNKNAVDAARRQKVIVYAYDSFISEWGPGPELAKRFKIASGYDLEYVSCEDGVQLVTRPLMEKDNVQADVVVGIDSELAGRALDAKIFLPFKPKNADKYISESLRNCLSKDWSLTPFDWSHFAMVYDTESDVAAPAHLKDLTKSDYRKKIILLDPRTSTPGRGFVAWTLAVFGDGYQDFWRALKPNILTVASGWSSGYGLFTKGEAPLVISYTTSPAYHVEYENTDRYKALIFDEGHIMQVEGAGILRGAANEKGAKAFMDFLVSQSGQDVLPLTQWMYPANNEVILPKSYQKAAPVATTTLTVDPAAVDSAIEQIVSILAD